MDIYRLVYTIFRRCALNSLFYSSSFRQAEIPISMAGPASAPLRYGSHRPGGARRFRTTALNFRTLSSRSHITSHRHRFHRSDSRSRPRRRSPPALFPDRMRRLSFLFSHTDTWRGRSFSTGGWNCFLHGSGRCSGLGPVSTGLSC